MFSTLLGLFTSAALSVWSRISGSVNVVIGEIADDELKIVHDEYEQFLADIHAGKSAGEAAADLWTRFVAAERAEFSTVAHKLLEMLVAAHGA